MSMESSQSKKKKRKKKKEMREESGDGKVLKKKKESRVKCVGWAVCICDVCVLCLPGTVVLLSVELHCTVRLSKLLMRIWGKYNLGARTWQTEGFHAMLLCQSTQAMPC